MPSPSSAITEQAWNGYRTELVRFVRRRVSDDALADDIAHDVLLRALSQAGSLRDPGKLRAWLYGITRNTIIDHYRALRPQDPLPEEIRAEEAEDSSRAEQELARCMTPLIDNLPAHYRDALRLAELEGLTQAEIARRERVSLSGAKSRVQRARRMVRDQLLACCRVELDRRGGVVDYAAGENCGSSAGCSPVGCPSADET